MCQTSTPTAGTPTSLECALSPEMLKVLNQQFLRILHILPFNVDEPDLQARAEHIVNCILACRFLTTEQLSQLAVDGITFQDAVTAS